MLFAPLTFRARVFIHARYHRLMTADGTLFPCRCKLSAAVVAPRRRESVARMKTRLSFLLALSLVGVALHPARSDDAAPVVREMRIDPATTGVPLGHVRLSVDPLTHSAHKDALEADYKVEVTPFASQSEAGRFSVALSGADLRRLADGEQISFTGQAVSQDGGNTSTLQGRATPVAGHPEGGDLRLQIESKRGKLVFHTTYHLIK